jgi:hypothetical protein
MLTLKLKTKSNLKLPNTKNGFQTDDITNFCVVYILPLLLLEH